MKAKKKLCKNNLYGSIVLHKEPVSSVGRIIQSKQETKQQQPWGRSKNGIKRAFLFSKSALDRAIFPLASSSPCRHRLPFTRGLQQYNQTQAPTTTGQQRKRNRCKMKMLSSSSRRDGDVVVVRSFAMPKHHQPAAGVVIGIPASFPPYCGPLAVAIVALVRLFWVASRPSHRGISQQRYPASAIGYKALLSVSHRDLFSLMSISFGSARRSNIMHAQKININVMLFSSAFLFCVKL